MPREGTRSQTGNSRPRIFQAIDTGPATPRRKPSLKSRLTPGPAKPAKEKKEKEKVKEKQRKKTGAGTGGGGGGGVVDRVRSAVGLAPRGEGKVQKKGGVKRAVQKVKDAAKIDKDTKRLSPVEPELDAPLANTAPFSSSLATAGYAKARGKGAKG